MKLLERIAFSFRQWFTRPATCNDKITTAAPKAIGAEAHFLRGLEFESGKGVVQDYAQAAHWYAQAAEQNHSLAQLNLAVLYAQGLGVIRDRAKSLRWLTRAAKLGNAAAQYRLGVQQYLHCRDSSKEATTEGRIEALKWVRLSAAQGCRGALGACEFVALGMTREEVAESAVRVGAFVAG
jgi:TPR repeat protein